MQIQFLINLKIEQMYGAKDDENKFISLVVKSIVENKTRLSLTSEHSYEILYM